MSIPSLALEPNRPQTAKTTRYDRSTLTSVNNFTDSPDFASPPLTLPTELKDSDYAFPSPAEAGSLSPASPSTSAETISITKKTTLIPLPNASLLAEPNLSGKGAPAINELRTHFEQSLNQTLEHLKQYLLAAVEAQVKTSVKTAELPAPQEFLAQVRDIVQAAVAPNAFHPPSLGTIGGLKPLPKLSFLNRSHGKWADSNQVPTTDKIPIPSSQIPTKSTFLETTKVDTQPKPPPFVTNPVPSPAEKLPWETQNPFL